MSSGPARGPASVNPFSCKIFEDMSHGGLVGEHTERFIQEVEKAHRHGRESG